MARSLRRRPPSLATLRRRAKQRTAATRQSQLADKAAGLCVWCRQPRGDSGRSTWSCDACADRRNQRRNLAHKSPSAHVPRPDRDDARTRAVGQFTAVGRDARARRTVRRLA